MSLLLIGCGSNTREISGDNAQSKPGDDEVTVGSETTQEDNVSETADMVAPLTDYVTEELMQRADMWPSCDDTALAAVMRKATAGEPVTIACIGGSITQGTISNGISDSEVGFKKSYTDIFLNGGNRLFRSQSFRLSMQESALRVLISVCIGCSRMCMYLSGSTICCRW